MTATSSNSQGRSSRVTLSMSSESYNRSHVDQGISHRSTHERRRISHRTVIHDTGRGTITLRIFCTSHRVLYFGIGKMTITQISGPPFSGFAFHLGPFICGILTQTCMRLLYLSLGCTDIPRQLMQYCDKLESAVINPILLF